MSGEAGEELDTPAARIMARRESRAAMPDRLKVAAPDDSSDEEWNGDDDEDEEEDGRVYLDASKCGRVRLHAVQGPAQSSSGLGVDDERRKSLADKGWARRTVVVNGVGASGAASFELVPGREQFGSGDDAAAEWERQMLQFTEDNFLDTGILDKFFFLFLPKKIIFKIATAGNRTRVARVAGEHHTTRPRLRRSPCMLHLAYYIRLGKNQNGSGASGRRQGRS